MMFLNIEFGYISKKNRSLLIAFINRADGINPFFENSIT